jgi:hypothetical protein
MDLRESCRRDIDIDEPAHLLRSRSIIANCLRYHSALDVNVHRLDGDASRFAFDVTPVSISLYSFCVRSRAASPY